MNHRNTPDPEWKLSPAQLIFGRPIRDFLPIKLNQYSPHECWILDRESREQAMKHRVHLGMEKWSANTRNLPALKVGQHVNIQNQHGAGKIAKRWDRTGIVVEDLGFNKYRVRVDGSGRVTDRNRQFLRLFKPAKSTFLPGPTPFTHKDPQPAPGAGHVPVGEPPVDPEHVPDAPMTNPLDTAAPQDTQMPNQRLATLPVQPSRSHHDDWTGAGLRAGWGAGGEYCPVPTPAMSSGPQTLDTTPTPSSPSTARETSRPPSPVRRSSRVRRPNQLYGPDMFDLSRD